MVLMGALGIDADGSHEFIKQVVVDLLSILRLNEVFSPTVVDNEDERAVFVFLVLVLVVVDYRHLVEHTVPRFE